MKKYTIKDIAKLSGVSVATVSRVINNNGRFSEQTRYKVEKVIKETGYQTNYSAKSLRMNRSFSIGILVPDITNYFFAETVQKIEEILFEQGFSTIICNTARDIEKENSYLKILESKGVDGLIVISGAEKFEFNSFDKENKNIPYVCIDREPVNKSDTIFISSNHYQGGFEATEKLISIGCKYPIIVTHNRKSSSSVERLEGFKDALKKNGYKYDPQYNNLLISNNENTFENDVIIFLKKHPKIDGIFSINDATAVKLLSILKSLNILVPEDIKLIGFDDVPQNKYLSPTLSSVKQDTNKIAQSAVKNLLQLIKSPENTGYTIRIPIALSLKESTQVF